MAAPLVLAALFYLACVTTSVGSESEPLVTVESVGDISISRGDAKEAEIHVTVAEGFHVQANPAANEFLIPLSLELDGDSGLKIGDVRYPKGELYRIEGSEEDLLIYDGRFSLFVTIRASAATKEGVRRLSGRLRYQACDDRFCRAPDTIAFEMNVTIHPRQPVDPGR